MFNILPTVCLCPSDSPQEIDFTFRQGIWNICEGRTIYRTWAIKENQKGRVKHVSTSKSYELLILSQIWRGKRVKQLLEPVKM